MIRIERRPARTAAVVGVLIIALLGTACGTRTTGHGYSIRARTGAVTVHLTGGARFAPAPAGAKPTLTPQQAWARYVKVNTSYHSSAIPRAVVSVRLGLPDAAHRPTGTAGHGKLPGAQQAGLRVQLASMSSVARSSGNHGAAQPVH